MKIFPVLSLLALQLTCFSAMAGESWVVCGLGHHLDPSEGGVHAI